MIFPCTNYTIPNKKSYSLRGERVPNRNKIIRIAYFNLKKRILDKYLHVNKKFNVSSSHLKEKFMGIMPK